MGQRRRYGCLTQDSGARQNRLIDRIEVRRRRRGQCAQRCRSAQHRLEFATLGWIVAQAGIDRFTALDPIQTSIQRSQEFLVIIVHHRPPPRPTGVPGRVTPEVEVV